MLAQSGVPASADMRRQSSHDESAEQTKSGCADEAVGRQNEPGGEVKIKKIGAIRWSRQKKW